MTMIEKVAHSLSTHAKRILENHLNIGSTKSLSYLPVATIEQVIGISVPEYLSLIEESGNQFAVFTSKECCIKSGAVYAYSSRDLENILKASREVLTRNDWPTNSKDFIRKLASEWLNDESPMLPVVKKIFGEG